MTPKILISQNEIKEMLSQFYNATGLRVGIHDDNMNILSEYPTRPQNIEEMCFCDVLRLLSPSMVEKCKNCDLNALNHVKQIKKTYIYKCHLGFTEAIIPILSHEEVISVLMIGQIRIEGENPPKFDLDFSESRDFEILKTAFNKIHCMDLKKFRGFAYLLEMCVQNIYDNRWIRCEEKTIIENFEEFVKRNIFNDISISDAAQALNVSRSHLSRIIKNKENTNFTDYVLDRKIEIAKNLLLSTSMSVKEISFLLKFNEPTYFMRCFKSKTGETCTSFRKKNIQ